MCRLSFQHFQTNTRMHSNGSFGHKSETYVLQPVQFHVLLPSLLLCNACALMTAYLSGSRYVQTPAYARNEQQPRQQRLAADKARRQVTQIACTMQVYLASSSCHTWHNDC